MSSLNRPVDMFASELQLLANPDHVREKRREWIAWVRRQFQGLSSLDPTEKRRVGQELNHVKNEIERLATERLLELDVTNRRDGQDLNPELPAPPMRLGRAHPTIVILRKMNAFFQSLGFEVEDGPEIESDWYNFAALNLLPIIQRGKCRTRSIYKNRLFYYVLNPLRSRHE